MANSHFFFKGDNMSIWNIKEEKRNIKKLNGDKVVDILIIGGGLTGLNSAYFLKNNKKVCVVDASVIGHGVTMGSTAKINYLQDSIYTKIIKATSYNNAVKYLNSQKESIDLLVNIIKSEKIDCDLEKVPSYIFANREKEIEALEKEVNFLKKNNINIKEKKLPMKVLSYKSFYVDDTYIFNPIKYLNGLYKILTKEGIKIYEKSKIIKIEKAGNKYICYGEKYKITANKVILASHYPFFLIPFITPLRCSIEKSYIIVSRVKKDGKFTLINTSNPIYSCRYYKMGEDIYQISLSKSHDITKNYNDLYYFDRVKDIFNLKEENIILKYTNSDIITPDYMPYIGKLKSNLYIGIGYNTWGMTNSVLAAKIITDDILNIENEYKEIFKPNRMNVSNIIKLPSYIFNNARSFLSTKIIKNKKWYKNKVEFITKNGNCLAYYKDEKGKKHLVYNKCPHLGCSLIFNEIEKTWDCPCHSSRFDIDGKCIKGPSNYDISYKK